MRGLIGVVICLALAGPAAAAAPRFEGSGQLQPSPSASPDSRFSLRATLMPVAPRPDTQARFLLAARLEGSSKAVCVRPDRIFGNGFESP